MWFIVKLSLCCNLNLIYQISIFGLKALLELNLLEGMLE